MPNITSNFKLKAFRKSKENGYNQGNIKFVMVSAHFTYLHYVKILEDNGRLKKMMEKISRSSSVIPPHPIIFFYGLGIYIWNFFCCVLDAKFICNLLRSSVDIVALKVDFGRWCKIRGDFSW